MDRMDRFNIYHAGTGGNCIINMKNSESILKIAPALLLAQKKIGAAKKDATNPFFHSSYADLGSVMEACKDALNDNGIIVLQPVGCDETSVYVETVLLHTSGEYISEKMRITPKSANNPQDQGSAISYARRYSLQSMCFIPAEDDDAEKATGKVTVVNVPKDNDPKWIQEEGKTESKVCKEHNKPLLRGVSKTKFTKDGNPKVYWYHILEDKSFCFGYSEKAKEEEKEAEIYQDPADE